MRRYTQSMIIMICIMLLSISCSIPKPTQTVPLQPNQTNVGDQTPSDNTDSTLENPEDFAAYYDSLAKTGKLREAKLLEISENGDVRIFEELYDGEEEYFAELDDIVENYSLDDIDVYLNAVDAGIETYETKVNSLWEELEDSI